MEKPYWFHDGYVGTLADPFVSGTELEGGHVANCLNAYSQLLGRLVGRTSESNETGFKEFLSSMVAEDFSIIGNLVSLLKSCAEIAQAVATCEKPAQIADVVAAVVQKISGLGEKEYLLLPAGWLGLTSQGWAVVILRRERDTNFTVTVCNSGSGVEYHLSTATDSKIKYKTCMTLPNIPQHRVSDPAFWLLIFSLWMGEPSEYHRVEVLYDVLLPWLAEEDLSKPGVRRSLPQAVLSGKDDMASTFRTPQRSNTSAAQSVKESILYLCRCQGFTDAKLKQMTLLLRRETLLRATEDLMMMAGPDCKNEMDVLVKLGATLSSMPTLDEASDAIGRVVGQDGLDAGLTNKDGARLPFSTLRSANIVGLYFSGSWCGPCQKFTPRLIKAYNNVLERHGSGKFEVLFVGSEKSEEEWGQYLAKMPWLAVPFHVTSMIAKFFGVSSLPTLLLFGPDGKLITLKGTEVISKDIDADNFPWLEAPPTLISGTDQSLLKYGCEQLSLASLKEVRAGRLGVTGLNNVKVLVETIDQLVAKLPSEDKQQGLPPGVDAQLETSVNPFHSFELLKEHDVEKYAGDGAAVRPPARANMLAVPENVTSLEQVITALVRCDEACQQLLNRAKESSTSSRRALHMEAVALITTLFTEILPMPGPMGTEPGNCVYHNGFANIHSSALVSNGTSAKDVQMTCLQRVFKLSYLYSYLWQSVDNPSRAFDSERCLTMGCMLSVFDAVIRVVHTQGENLTVPGLLREDNGYSVSTTVCQNSRSYLEVCKSLELVNPKHTISRDTMLAYLESVESGCKYRIFEYRMPDKIEIKKYSPTVVFLRRIMEQSGYQLMAEDQPMAQHEMEALMEWMFGERSKLCQEKPEFALLRDMAALFKFGTTMETREAELYRKRKQVGYQYWRLSFDDSSGQRNSWARSSWEETRTLQWEIANFRGPDLDTADIQLTAFGTRELSWGEGPVVNSPANVAKIVGKELPSEDDILHLEKLPTFGDTLSAEESELLLSYLTVPYVAIPLVLDFFAGQDRSTYLFSEELQEVLRSVLFEPNAWISGSLNTVIKKVPLRQTVADRRDANIQKMMDARFVSEDQALLGTRHGLLVNELSHSPAAVMEPFFVVLDSIKDLANCSVYSPNASYVLYMAQIAVDMEGYMVYVTNLGVSGANLREKEIVASLADYRKKLYDYIHTRIAPTLERWREEAEKTDDLLTACVVHSYLALVWSNVDRSELSPDVVAAMVGSLAYVRNWHGFGLGQQRSEMTCKDGDELLSAEERLIRFLQAQGINTNHLSKNALESYLSSSGSRRPLFLHIGRETIRVPTLIRVRPVEDGKNKEGDTETYFKLPPADVPEFRLFNLLQRHRRGIVSWFEESDMATINGVLDNIIRVALRNGEFTCDGWTKQSQDREGLGRYVAKKAELRFDAQTAEVLWRNDELRPVPDSMTQYSDFETIFGREALHCGVVKRNEHRFWVHVIGTDYDLMEWDEPINTDQGIGAPTNPPKPADPESGGGYICLVCGGADGRCFRCEACTSFNCSQQGMAGSQCSVCESPRPGGLAEAPPAFNNPFMNARREPDKVPCDDVIFNGVRYNRKYDPYDDEVHEHRSERWAIDIIRPIINMMYPPIDDDHKIPYPLLLPETVYHEGCTTVRVIGCDAFDKEDATWKEIVALKTPNVCMVYNLVSHGRRMYRTLVYSSNARLALHSLPPKLSTRDVALSELVRYAAGDFKKKRVKESSLVVTRRNKDLGGLENYLPPRLLQGLIPSALLESFNMWQGEDGIIRGSPINNESQWFSYLVEVVLENGTNACNASIRRRALNQGFTNIVSSTIGESNLVRNDAPAPVAPAPVAEIKEMDVLHLVELGFAMPAAKLALSKTGGNLGAAAEWLFNEANQAEVMAAIVSEPEAPMDIDMPDAPAASASESISPKKQQQENLMADHQKILSRMAVLKEEGYSSVACEHALTLFGGDVDLAKSWLVDEVNAESIAILESGGALQAGETAGEIGSAPAALGRSESKIGESNRTGDLYLLNLLDAPENSVLSRLARALTRIEDLSHILVWTTSYPEKCLMEGSQSLARIAVVELPRLQLKFQPQKGPDGTVKLYSLDHPGWFISDVAEVGCDFLDSMLQGIDQSLVIGNHAHEMQLLVANHDAHRPRVRGRPFTRELVFDRGSSGWQEVMQTRTYLYPVHTSKTFVLPNTLGSLLYMVLLRFLSRQYEDAFRMIDSSCIDTELSSEEQWIFDQFEKTLDDNHPDAHACRLKMSLAVLYSPVKCKWETHQVMDAYLSSVQHVSSSCLLTDEEELDLLHNCKSGTTLIKNRLEYLKGKAGTPVEQKGPSPRWGGQPWVKLCALGRDYVQHNATKVTRVHYKLPKGARPMAEGVPHPQVLEGSPMLELVLTDALIMDEVSGSNRHLGFLFMYEMLTGGVLMMLGDRDCTSSLANLLLRYWHLKHARWGKETVDDGESEGVVSRELVILASMLSIPSLPWPQLPQDNQDRTMLRMGLNLYDEMGRGSNVKAFMDMVDLEFQTSFDCGERQLLMQGILQANMDVRAEYKAAVVTMTTRPYSERCNGALRLMASDTSCDQRMLTEMNIVADCPELALKGADIGAYANAPLSVIGLEKYVSWVAQEKEAVSSEFPFDLYGHEAAGAVVSQDLLNRMAGDVQGYANMANSTSVPLLHHFSEEALKEIAFGRAQDISEGLAMLENLVTDLEAVHNADSSYVEKAVKRITTEANAVVLPEVVGHQYLSHIQFWLNRFARRRTRISMEFLSSAILSSRSDEDVRRANPFISRTDNILKMVVSVMLRTNRSFCAGQAIFKTRTFITYLKQILNSASRISGSTGTSALNESISTHEKLKQMGTDIAESIAVRRFFMHQRKDTTATVVYFDPRFLVFEYVFNILLRKRQVEMVTWFVDNIRNGNSRVQQMIMGAGKTTVVGPLLVLILADGKSLVTQVMPSALLEQSRNILRRCFASIITKKVYTLEFDRSVDDSAELVQRLRAKMRSAALQRGVICAPPEAIKSLFLKFVELSHSIEQLDMADLVPSTSNRNNREITRLRDTMIARSDMADALVHILDMWTDGVLIMDEVDVLLHPLRSELNFPIGHKVPIDLSGHRWNLPIHIIEAIFYHSRGSICEAVDSWDPTCQAVFGGGQAIEILNGLQQAIHKGYELHKLQKNPHLVLLDTDYYHEHIKVWICRWTLLWLCRNFAGSVSTTTEVLQQYLMGDDIESIRSSVEGGLIPEAKKLLNLAASWTRELLPHCLSKIDRVSFGILSPADLQLVDPNTPYSRLVMAVPFVGKDVPSRSSEFAHPDVLIGLTVLAFRYEGLRKSDLKKVVTQLKHDFSRQVGPKEKRPASVQFRQWIDLATKEQNKPAGSAGILPLQLFQVSDAKQFIRLYELVRSLPQLLHYLLRQHIFPSTMNFQQTKISACGHELGSSILFGKRIGFSGTPSNLLPIDLGDCEYEPGSDGRVIHVLTNPKVVSATVKSDWTARSLLYDIATADPPVHALIDTGAFITNMDNEEVARYLLEHLPEWMEGVVYLDRQDRQMILVRGTKNAMQLSQCGISPARRFTFYDQVHTTGMDIKQAPTAVAVLTIGKDMTFRDYAQGAYRMRGIGRGQNIHLFIIPEVQNRIEQELGTHAGNSTYKYTGRHELDVPAWLLVNSMRMQSLQFLKMSTQELYNVWRKRSLGALTDEVHALGYAADLGTMDRLHRFGSSATSSNDAQMWLRRCVMQFREPVSHAVEDCVPTPRPFRSRIEELVEKHSDYRLSERDAAVIAQLTERVGQITDGAETGAVQKGYNSEVVHEQEQEEEQEEEQEQEEQKISAFTRDDEQHNPWAVDTLRTLPTCKLGDDPFYRFNQFHVRKDMKPLNFPEHLLLTDNFFRPRWVGLGERRLKNVSLVMEWIPDIATAQRQARLKRWVAHLFKQMTAGCGKNGDCSNPLCACRPGYTPIPPNDAAVKCLATAQEKLARDDKAWLSSRDSELFCEALCPTDAMDAQDLAVPQQRMMVALSLSEGETLRWMIHNRQPAVLHSGIAIRTVSGRALDRSMPFYPEDTSASAVVSPSLQCLRFYNCEMFYTDVELENLEAGLKLASLEDRRAFFSDVLRLRRRQRNLWGDTPLARIFTPREEWHLLRKQAMLEQIINAIQNGIRLRRLDPASEFLGHDSDNDGKLSYSELQRCFEAMRLGFSAGDYYEAIRLVDAEGRGSLSLEEFVKVFKVPEQLPANEEMEVDKGAMEATAWQCMNCTFINASNSRTCEVCELGWTGQRECPPNKWVCVADDASGSGGGCGLFNPKSQFYCEVCNRARPDLSSVRF